MKKVIVLLRLSVSYIFAALNLQSASKDELMSIKGVGPAKADAIIKYRKTNTIKSADDLQKVKGFGPKVLANIKGEKKVSPSTMDAKKKKSAINDNVKAKMKEARKSGMKKKDLKIKRKALKKEARIKKQKINKNLKSKNMLAKKTAKAKKKAKNLKLKKEINPI